MGCPAPMTLCMSDACSSGLSLERVMNVPRMSSRVSRKALVKAGEVTVSPTESTRTSVLESVVELEKSKS